MGEAMRILGWMVVAMLAGAGAAQAECVARYSTKFGDRSDGDIVGVRAGQTCTIPVSLRSPGPRVSGATLQDIEIVRQPNAGVARKSGSSILYTPNAAFKGTDSFFVRFVFATADGEPRYSRVRFAVRN